MIDEYLSEWDEGNLLLCNMEMILKYRNILLAPNTGLVEVSEEFMRKQSPVMKASSICLIEKLLIDEINEEKFGKTIEEESKGRT